MNLSPIALFVYNRPLHTRQTVEALQNNDLARDSDLVVFSDAPRSAEQAGTVREVRDYIRGIDGFKSVTLVERETNFGLARSIIDGVTRLCKEYGRVIVLEDDLITSPHFLKYMNDALDIYKNEDRVMHISGSIYPIGDVKDETLFLRIPLCWGWATWDRAWRHFTKSNDVMLKFDRKMRRDFTFNNTYHSWMQLENNKNGSIDTWFIYWYAALFLRGGMSLFPGKSLVKNIGMDGSGVHCGTNYIYDMEPSASAIRITQIPVRESAEAVKRHEDFFRKQYSMPPPVHIRIFRKILRAIGKLANAIRPDGAGKK